VCNRPRRRSFPKPRRPLFSVVGCGIGVVVYRSDDHDVLTFVVVSWLVYEFVYSFMAQIVIYDYLWVLILGTRSKVWDFSINDAVGINLYRFVTNVYRLTTFLVRNILTLTTVGILGCSSYLVATLGHKGISVCDIVGGGRTNASPQRCPEGAFGMFVCIGNAHRNRPHRYHHATTVRI
jgi:hypothetical protein